MKAIIAAGPAHKDRLREAIQLQSQNVQQRSVYTHTGWRDVNGDKVFLSGSGALGSLDIEVELEPPLQRYQLLVEPCSNTEEAVKASFNFLLVAKPEVAFVNPSHFVREEWLSGDNAYSEVDSSLHSEYLAVLEKMLLALYEAGVPLMSGTDTPLPIMIPGFALHEELEVMVDIGLSPYDVLKTSTYNPAMYLGELDEFGTIEVGKRADLVLLKANPLEDITNTQLIDGVMVRGRWYTRADLDMMLEEVANANN